ncbi:unnamed protein product [Prunus armeniaca]
MRQHVPESALESEEELEDPPSVNNPNLHNHNKFRDYRIKDYGGYRNKDGEDGRFSSEETKKGTGSYMTKDEAAYDGYQQSIGGSPKSSKFQGKAGNEGSNRTFNRVQTPNQPQKENLYAKPMIDICYRCYKPGHCSNVYPEWREVNLIEEVGDAKEKDEAVDDDYTGNEFTIEEGMERLNLVLQ